VKALVPSSREAPAKRGRVREGALFEEEEGEEEEEEEEKE
jgi:hypothetical protein